jgi:hypothetical protein
MADEVITIFGERIQTDIVCCGELRHGQDAENHLMKCHNMKIASGLFMDDTYHTPRNPKIIICVYMPSVLIGNLPPPL